MSSVLVGHNTSAHPPANGNGAIHIVHYDATVRRKEKMKQKAEHSGTNGSASAPETVAATPQAAPAAPVVAPQPVPAAPVPAATAIPQPAPIQQAPPQPVQQPPAAAPSAAPAAQVNGESLTAETLEKFLVNFVVEQTGYPPEMVELDADLEADLGIDSIKKAQLFGEMAEHIHVHVELNENMSLDDFPTLRHVMEFLLAAANNQAPASAAAAPVTPAPQPVPAPAAPAPVASAPPVQIAAPSSPTPAPAPAATSTVQAAPPATAVQSPAPAAAAPAPATPSSSGKKSLDDLSSQELEQFLVSFVVEQTGYPPEMVELDADLEADLGIDSIKKAQMLGELGEQVDVQIEITEDMSLDDFPTLRHIVDLIISGKTAAA